MNKFFKYFSIPLLITILSITTISGIFAYEEVQYFDKKGWNADEILSENAEQNYNIIENVYITEITTDNDQTRIDTLSWVRGMYYFFSTKTQLKDMPFNYLVGWDGTIYEGKDNIQDLIAPIEGEKGILIGYMSNYDNAEMTDLGKIAMKSLLTDIVSEYEIKSDDIFAKDWNIKPTEDLQKSFIQLTALEKNPAIKNSLDEIKEDLDYTSSLQIRNYKAEILNLEYEENLEIGNNYEVKIKVKNTGETNWYNDSSAEITVAKKDNSSSEFFVTGEWLSDSQVSVMNIDILKPNEEAEFVFNISTPFSPDGEITEEFILKTKSGKEVDNSNFTITVNVSTAGLQIAEVKQTPTGYLNVRETPRAGGELITQILPGEKFILLDTQSGWGKLRLKNGEEGWAALQYLNRL